MGCKNRKIGTVLLEAGVRDITITMMVVKNDYKNVDPYLSAKYIKTKPRKKKQIQFALLSYSVSFSGFPLFLPSKNIHISTYVWLKKKAAMLSVNHQSTTTSQIFSSSSALSALYFLFLLLRYVHKCINRLSFR